MSILSLFAAVKIDPGDIGYEGGVTSANESLSDILTLVYAWAAILAVFVIIVASFLFVTARGDPAQMKRSKDAVRGAVVGLIVVLVAFTITQFILGSL